MIDPMKLRERQVLWVVRPSRDQDIENKDLVPLAEMTAHFYPEKLIFARAVILPSYSQKSRIVIQGKHEYSEGESQYEMEEVFLLENDAKIVSLVMNQARLKRLYELLGSLREVVDTFQSIVDRHVAESMSPVKVGK